MNILEYVEKFGDLTFDKNKFNEVDNVIFSTLAYLDFSYTSINRGSYTLEYIGKQYLEHNNYKGIKKLGLSPKEAYKLLKKVIKAKRYKDLIVHDYVYSYDEEKQFSAMMFKINNNLEYMSFEGTDELVSAWKEDFEMAYKFPIPAQKDAIKYANKHIKLSGPNVIIGGHSKGGNLAMVGAMYTNILKQIKIKKVYNNDGPGLRTKEYNSLEYKRIKNKLVHFVPEYSLFGMILRHSSFNVISSSRKNFFAHATGTWLVKDHKFIQSKLSKKSIDIKDSLLIWLNNHTDEEKEIMVKELFSIFEDSNIKKFFELSNINNIRKVINNARNIDDHTKELFVDLIKFNFFNKKDNVQE